MRYYIKAGDVNREREDKIELEIKEKGFVTSQMIKEKGFVTGKIIKENGFVTGEVFGGHHTFSHIEVLNDAIKKLENSEVKNISSHLQNVNGLTLFHKVNNLLHVSAYGACADGTDLRLAFICIVDFDSFNLAVTGLYAKHKLGNKP